MPIPITRPTMRRRYMHSVLTQLVDEEVGPGKTTRELVSGLSGQLGMAGGVALCSAYAAITAAADVLGLTQGDRVALPALSPSVYLDALRSRGLEVCLVDVESDSGTASPDTLRAVIASGVKAALIHHTLGLPMRYEAATESGTLLLEDLSATLTAGSPTEDGLLPAGADLALVSLEDGGLLTGGTGAILLARKKPLLPALKTAAGNASVHQQLANMNAALALAQLADVSTDRTRRQEIALLYRSALRKSRHEPLVAPDDAASPVSIFPVRLKDGMAEARQYARKHGVETRPAFEEVCASSAPELAESCPNARRLILSCLAFPLYPMLSRKDAEAVCRVLATLP
jgi:dTDP-4-amino-4,6-dideoxygalactose transaminase